MNNIQQLLPQLFSAASTDDIGTMLQPVTFLKIAASQVVFIDLPTNQIMSLRIVS